MEQHRNKNFPIPTDCFKPFWFDLMVSHLICSLITAQFCSKVHDSCFSREVTLAEPFPKTLEFSLANKKQG